MLKIIPLVFLFVSLLSCNTDSNDASMPGQSASSTPEITVEELRKKVQSGEEIYLLDVRTHLEWATERLAFTDDRINYDSIPYVMDRLPEEKDAEMYMFCRSGRRSGIAAEYLRAQGYTNVYNVAGGIIAWKAAGYETVSGE